MTAGPSSREALMAAFRERHGLGAVPEADLNLALTHRSWAFENGQGPDNERLEFLGDSVISLVVSEFLLNEFPMENEGELSKRRARLVSRPMLGQRAAEMGLGPLLLLGVGEEKTGGSRRRSTLGGALEALVGTIHVRLGHEASRAFVLERIVGHLMAAAGGDDTAHGDYKSRLQEWTQSRHYCLPAYDLVEERGPDHEKQFVVDVILKGKTLARATGGRIKIAENEAARLALARLKRESRAGDGGGS